jgi:hypothetical protein
MFVIVFASVLAALLAYRLITSSAARERAAYGAAHVIRWAFLIGLLAAIFAIPFVLFWVSRYSMAAFWVLSAPVIVFMIWADYQKYLEETRHRS